MSLKTLVILSYIESYTDDYVINLCKMYDYIICADGGQDLAERLNIKPDVCIGDFDSTSIHYHFDCEYIRYPAEKDITDAEACLEHAIGQGYKYISFLGGIGGRLDHTMGALALLQEVADEDVYVELIDMKNSVHLLKPNETDIISRDMYKYFSIVPLDEDIQGLTIKGAKYPLSDATVKRASTLCISNEFAENNVIVKSKIGAAYIIQSNDR